MRIAAIAGVAACLLSPLASTIHAVGPRSGYIVVLKPGNDGTRDGQRIVGAEGGRFDSAYGHALRGFSMHADANEIARVRRDPAVAYVEPDVIVHIDAQTVPTGVSRTGATANTSIGIDGVDDRRPNVDVAILDTGIDLTHPDLNVAGGVDCLGTVCVAGGNDDNFHGTHVAGIVGALDNGVGVVGIAPGARLWAVKVLDATGSGPLSAIIRGVDWVTAHSGTISVANMSFGFTGASQALFDSIQAAVDHGVAFAVAAGNSHVDAATVSPASFTNVLTVSALADFDGLPGGLATSGCIPGADDTLASFSNFGAVDVAAPGACITSTIPVRLGSYGVLSGTSMASPYVAGALALLASTSRATTASGVAAMYQRVVSTGNFNWTDTSGDGVKEPLLDVSNPSLFAMTPPVCAAIPAAARVGFWKGEGGLLAQTGPSLSGSANFAPGEVGQGFSMDSASSLTAPSLPVTTTGLTFEAWLKPSPASSAAAVQTIASRWDFPSTDDSTRTFALLLMSDGTLEFDTDETTLRRPVELRASAPQLFDGFFHHVAATWDAARIAVYVDGVQVGSQVSQGGLLNPNTATTVRLGGQSHGGTGDLFPYTGVIDEPSIWSRALSPGEVAAIANATSAGTC
jgi:subtilisin family serine protease